MLVRARAACVLALVAATTLVVPAGAAPGPAPAAPSALAKASSFRTYDGATPLRKIEPGAVLKTRTVSYSIEGIDVPLDVVQLLYRTADQLGRPTVNVTSVIEPPLSAVTGPADRVIAYGSFYDSLNPKDSPSYALAGGTSPGGAAVHAETALMVPFLLEGYPVVMADTEGATADFVAGPEYGRATLDSIRAVLASPRADVAPGAKVGLFGYSGGAIATNWAAALAPRYAPGVNRRLVGAAEGGLLVAPARNLRYVQGSQIWAGVLAQALIGAARAFELDLQPYLNAYGKRLFQKMRHASIAEVLGAYPGLTWKKIARARYDNPEQVAVYVDAVNQLNLGRAPIPTTLMFIGQGANGELEGTSGSTPGIGRGDGVMIAGDVRTLARRYCAHDTTVRYQQYDATSHIATVPLWLPEAIAWIEARFAGAAAPSSCGKIAKGNSLAPVPAP